MLWVHFVMNFLEVLQFAVIRADVHIAAVLHSEASRDRAELRETESLVQVPRMDIALDDRIELQYPEAEAPALRQTILDQLLADVSASGSGRDRIACVAYVSAPSDVVRMQDV